MSKELEALKNIVNEISNYKLHGLGDKNWLGIQDVLKDIDTIEKALTPPTAEEVCNALSEYGIKTGDWEKVWFKDNDFYADEWTLCYVNKNGGLELSSDIDPKSHILLGKFYEKEKK